jgi:hypothetical protein
MGAYPFYQDFEIVITDLSYANFVGSSWITQGQVIDEGDSLNFYITASDPNGNDLEYEWLLDGEEVSIESAYSFLTDENFAGEYEITLYVTDNFGNRNELYFLWNITVNDVVSVENDFVFSEYSLQNFPNPFNPSTTISFETTNVHENAQIEIYNVKGQKVKSFSINQFTNPPIHQVIWNGTDEENQPVSSGIYMYQLKVDGKTIASKKCLLMK